MNKQKNWQGFLFAVLILVVSVASLVGCGQGPLYLKAQTQEAVSQEAAAGQTSEAEAQTGADQASEAEVQTGADETGGTCFVYICGAVRHPGVYELPAGSRVFEAVQQAGGLRKGALAGAVNQAQEITDGQMIEIPDRKEAERETADREAREEGLVNINTATAAELMTLNGIGQAKAAAIIAYREENGSFQCVEDLQKVSGIGEATYANLKDQITV